MSTRDTSTRKSPKLPRKSKKQKEIAEETIYEIANVAAYAVDDLNINDKGKLERKLYKLSNKAFKKARTQS